MAYLIFKAAASAMLIVLVSELGKRSTLVGGLLASVPLVSVLAFVWIYLETGDVDGIAALASSILWLVIPSLLLFLTLPSLLRAGYGFWVALAVSSSATAAAYVVMVTVLAKVGVEI